MATFVDVLPTRDALLDALKLVTPPWLKRLNQIRDALNTAPQREIATLELTGKTAAISATAIPANPLVAGYYRVSTFLRVTTAAGVSSSVAVTIAFTSGAVACSYTLSTLNANDVNEPVSDTRVLKVDSETDIEYSTTYASDPAAAMTYELSIVLERVET